MKTLPFVHFIIRVLSLTNRLKCSQSIEFGWLCRVEIVQKKAVQTVATGLFVNVCGWSHFTRNYVHRR
jgi:hypothetical protein